MDLRSEKALDELLRERKLLSFRLGVKGPPHGLGFGGLELRVCAAQRDKWAQSLHAGNAFSTAFSLKTRYNLPAAVKLHTLLGVEAVPRLQIALTKRLDQHKLKVTLGKSCHAKSADSLDFRAKLRLPPASALRLHCCMSGGQSFWELALKSKHENLRFLRKVLTRCSLAQALAGEFRASARLAFSYEIGEQLEYSFDATFELPSLTPRMKLFLAGPLGAGVEGRLGVLFDPLRAVSDCFAYLRGQLCGVEWDARVRSSGQAEGVLGLALTPEVRLRQTVSLNLADLLWQRGAAVWGVCVDVQL